MNVFVTGGSGYTGSIVIRHLIERGHKVVALARRLPAPVPGDEGVIEWRVGDFSNGPLISEMARAADAVIHIGASHDAEMERLDRIVIDAIADGLAGTGRAFISTSATPVYGDTGPVPRDEHEPIEHPHPLRAWRARHDQHVVALSGRGIRGIVVRPPYIYGRAGGLLSDSIKQARSTGRALYIGDGQNWTSVVHVDALARLYSLTLEEERAEGIYNAASDEIVRGADIATAIAATFGPGIASSDRARSHLGWVPTSPSIISELIGGSYRTGPLLDYHNR